MFLHALKCAYCRLEEKFKWSKKESREQYQGQRRSPVSLVRLPLWKRTAVTTLRHENTLYGEASLIKTVSKAGEQWRFGIELDEIESFTAAYGFVVSDHKCARELESSYFQDENGRPAGRINATHCLVTAERQRA